MSVVTLAAPAKLTWSLEVVGRRNDGLHDLRAEMTTLTWGDTLTVDDEADYVVVRGPFSGVPVGDDNLVARALALVGRRAGVTIDKVIPPGAGLGGGSADAGAVLRWAGGVPAREALALGSDVPFCQRGGRAIVEGAGDELTAVTPQGRPVTLALLAFGIDTGACYRAYDELVAEGSRPEGRNHLAAAARRVEPRLARTMDWLAATLGQRVQLAGSGSTLFVEGHLEPGVDAWSVTGPEGPVRFVQTEEVGAEGG